MSRYEWESGTIKLPTAEFARVRKAVEQADREYREAVFAQAQEFWKGLTRKQQTDPLAYWQAVLAHNHATHERADRLANTPSRGWGTGEPKEWAQADRLLRTSEAVHDLLSSMVSISYAAGGKPVATGKPRRVQVSDMQYPTNRTTRFGIPGGTIEFNRDASSVTWDVADGNHAREFAYADVRATAFWAALKGVLWTRGTGGIIVGNDEYNSHSRELGSGGNYVTRGVGPIGAAHPEAWSVTAPYRDSTGRLVATESFPGRRALAQAASKAAGTQGRVPRGVTTGGQFTTVARGETGVRLAR